MQVLIPLAGAGKRFEEAGYALPKPLIPVDGIPMIVRAVQSLPVGNRYIFLCRSEHLNAYPLEKTLKDAFPSCTIMSVDHLTEGQACTCLLAEAAIDMDQPLLIGACDNGMQWCNESFDSLTNNPTIDAAIWTFSNYAGAARNPKAYGWVKHKQGTAEWVSVKVPISDKPLNDEAVVGTFYFRKAKHFVKYAHQMIRSNKRINNEFYVDSVMNELIDGGLNVAIFPIMAYICWGTPNDLRTYEYFQKAFSASEWHPYKQKAY